METETKSPEAPGLESDEIDSGAALAEDASVAPAKPSGASADASEDKAHKDVIDTIVPKAEPREWVIGDEGTDEHRKYVQRPLSYFGKMQFFSLVGEVIDKAVSGDEGVRLSNLFDVPDVGPGFNASAFREADTFVQAAGKLLTYAPDFLEKSYCIWLNIPDYERPWAIEQMSKPAAEGGLSDDDGIEIIEIFIDQNWEALEGFFRDKLVALRDRVQSHRKETTTDQS